jgi:hypothetical protein
MSSLPTPQQLSAWLEVELGTKPLSLDLMTSGHSDSAVYEVGLPDQQLILKINPRPEVSQTLLHNLSVLGRLALPRLTPLP